MGEALGELAPSDQTRREPEPECEPELLRGEPGGGSLEGLETEAVAGKG